MRFLIFFLVGLQILNTLGAANYEDDDDYEYVYDEDYEYVDDCLDADDDGYCETDEDYSDEGPHDDDAEPEFGEDATTVRVDMGNTARITCTVNNLGSSVISWKKDNSFLSLGASPLSDDPRLSVIMTDSSSTLTITLVRIEDAGEYVCHVATNPTPIAKTFSVEIKGPPNVKIMNKPPSGTFTKQAGSSLTILCQGEGDPTPTLSWKRLNSQMPASQSNQNSGSLQFSSISENDAGTYQCIAGNGFGQPAIDSVQILVKHKPVIYVQENYVENEETNKIEALQLICSVQAYPAAETSWTRSDGPLPEDRMSIKNEDGRHILEISNPQKSDVGVYTCEAVNAEGTVYSVLNGKENDRLPGDEAEIALKQLDEGKEKSESPASRGHNLIGSFTFLLFCLSLRVQL